MKSIALILLLSLSASAKTYIVINDQAKAYDAPSAGAQAVGHVVKGKKINSIGETEGYVQVNTKSGRTMWIKTSDIEEANPTQPQEVATEQAPPAENQSGEEKAPSKFFEEIHITWDLGVAGGSYRGFTYNEADLGVNVFFNKWLAWRNAGFMRFVQPKNYYGLDSSARFFYSPGLMDFIGLTVYGGPGYRIVSDGGGWSAPFAEGGMDIHIGGFNLGAGIKVIYNSFVDKNVTDDTQFFVTLSGSGIIR